MNSIIDHARDTEDYKPMNIEDCFPRLTNAEEIEIWFDAFAYFMPIDLGER